MGLGSSGGKETLHALNVDDVLRDRRGWESPRGKERRGIRVGFREKYRGETHLNRSHYLKNATRIDKG